MARPRAQGRSRSALCRGLTDVSGRALKRRAPLADDPADSGSDGDRDGSPADQEAALIAARRARIAALAAAHRPPASSVTSLAPTAPSRPEELPVATAATAATAARPPTTAATALAAATAATAAAAPASPTATTPPIVAPRPDGGLDMFAPTLALEDAGEGDGRVAAAGAGPPQADLRENWDDAEGYYVTVVGEVLDGRYRVTAPLGKGVFSTVVRARREPSADPADDAAIAAPVDVAIKIVRRNDLMQAAAEHEIKVLETLGRADPRGERHVARLLASFWHKQHRCLVFEAMHTDLRAVLRDHGAGRGLRLETVAVMARHLFLALGLLRDCGYVHLDIKPDNVLLAADRQSVVLADLGSATDVPQQAATPYLASRFYRAPEVILGHDPSAAVDTWAAGCTLAELATGQILFAGRDNNDMLFRIMQTLGKVPHRLIRRGPTAAVSAHFDGGPALLFRQHTRDRLTGRPVARLLAIAAGPASAADALAARFPHCPSSLNAARTPFERRLWHLVDLVERCLALNPDRRITPAAALAHPFIAGPWAPSASAEASS